GAAEIIFGAGAADGRKLRVAVEVELDFPFAPPAVVMYSDAHGRADVVPAALDAVEDSVHLFVSHRVDTPELSMEVGSIFRHVGEHIVDLIISGSPFAGMTVFQRDAAALAKRHLP